MAQTCVSEGLSALNGHDLALAAYRTACLSPLGLLCVARLGWKRLSGFGPTGNFPISFLSSAVFIVTYLTLACCQGPR